MANGRTEAYEGTRAFAFVSYCHKDDQAVLPIIEGLARNGVRVWYDEGINPGEEWPSVIQDHLERCSVFVAFVSSASQVSHSCRKELNEALTLGKPTIPVLLEDCEKSVATRALLARLQAMKCEGYQSAEACAADLARAVAKMCPDAVEDDAVRALLGKSGSGAQNAKTPREADGTRKADGAREADGTRGTEPGAGSERDFLPSGTDQTTTAPTRPKRRIAVAAAIAALLVAALVAVAAFFARPDDTTPFWGVWVAASQSQEQAQAQSAELANSGFDALVVKTSDWSNLNADEWYAVSAGRHVSESDAKAQLDEVVAAGYASAYVKYTGSNRASGGEDAEATDTYETVKIILSGNKKESGSTDNTLEADLSIVKERFDAFAGEGACTWSEDSGRYIVELPRSSFGNMDITQALRCYLVRPIKVFLGKASSDGAPSGDAEPISVPREAIQSVAIEDGPLPGLDTSTFGELFPEDYKVVRMTLTDEYVKANAKVLDEWGNDLVVSQDVGYTSDYYYYGNALRDGNAVLFVDNCQGKIPNLLEAIEFNYTHDALSDGFEVWITHDSFVDWEVPGDGSSAGDNQVPSSELSGKLALLKYSDGSHADASEIAEGAQIDIDAGLKRRMDALGVPYAFGHFDEAIAGNEMKRNTVFKVSLDSIFTREVHAMSSRRYAGCTLFFEGNEATAYPDLTAFEFDQEADGHWRITLNGKGSVAGRATELPDDIAKFASHLSEGDSVSFLLNGFTMLTGAYRGYDDLGGLLFEDVRSVDGTPVADGDSLVPLEFFRACVETMNLVQSTLVYEGAEAVENGLPLMDEELKVEDLDEYEEIIEAVHAAAPDSKVVFDQPKCKVGLNLPIDGNLPERGLTLARKVYEAVGYKHAEFGQIIVYLIDEDEAEGGRARIGFSRTMDYETGAPKIMCNVVIDGERLDAYATKIKALMAEDSFYAAALKGVDAAKL